MCMSYERRCANSQQKYMISIQCHAFAHTFCVAFVKVNSLDVSPFIHSFRRNNKSTNSVACHTFVSFYEMKKKASICDFKASVIFYITSINVDWLSVVTAHGKLTNYSKGFANMCIRYWITSSINLRTLSSDDQKTNIMIFTFLWIGMAKHCEGVHWIEAGLRPMK